MTGTAHVAVLRGGTVWTGGVAPRLLPRTDLLIADGVVAELSPGYRGRADVEIDAEGCLVLPGLVNAHVHPGATPRARSLTEDADMQTGAAYYHAVGQLLRLGVEEMTPGEFSDVMEWDTVAMLLGGATTLVAEMIVSEESGAADLWVAIADRLGFRAHLGLTYPNRLGAIGYVEKGRLQAGDAGDVGAALQAGLRLHDRWHGGLGGRLRVHLSPHGPDTVPDEILRETKRHCAERGISAHLHLAQHPAEVAAIRARSGKSPVAYLHDIGFLGPDVVGTHTTFVDDADIRLLAATGTHVAHASYRKAKEGITSPFWEFLDQGVNVAIATDSFSHDLIQDLKLAALLGKIRTGSVGRPTADQALRCATHGAARALRRDDVGQLEPGAAGDSVVVDLSTPFNAPVFDPVRALVYYSSAADIRHTLVAGRPVVRDGRVLGVDMPALRLRATAACERLWALARDRGLMPAALAAPTVTPRF